MVMKKVNIFEAKARLSECVDAVQRGEQVVICRRNRPVAELRAIGSARTTPRPIGGANGLEIPSAFFEPLPDDTVAGFLGEVPSRAPARVVARSAPDRPAASRTRRRARS